MIIFNSAKNHYVVSPHLNGSDEGLQHIVSVGNKENYPLVIMNYSLLSRTLGVTFSG